jgi:hypothetical protein
LPDLGLPVRSARADPAFPKWLAMGEREASRDQRAKSFVAPMGGCGRGRAGETGAAALSLPRRRHAKLGDLSPLGTKVRAMLV